jgi:Domain of unknown function (DUF4192)
MSAATTSAVPVGEPECPAILASSPAGVVGLVPWLLRYLPGDADLVVIGTVPPRGRVRLTVRLDLPDPAIPVLAAAQTRHAVAVLAVQGCTRVTVVGFGADQLIAPAVARVLQAATAAGLEPGALLRAHGGRYWSYSRTHPGPRPAEGIPYSLDSDPVAVAFQAAGAPPPLASRDALATTIAPATRAEAASMSLAIRRATLRARRLDKRGDRPGRRARQLLLVISGIRAVTGTIRVYQDDGSITSHDQFAWLALTLAIPQVRDAAWRRMNPVHRHAHKRLWTILTRIATPGHVTVPAALLAFTVWQDGDGALANLALDRAQADGPGDEMTRMLRAAIISGAPPSLADPAALTRQARTARGTRRAWPEDQAYF